MDSFVAINLEIQLACPHNNSVLIIMFMEIVYKPTKQFVKNCLQIQPLLFSVI